MPHPTLPQPPAKRQRAQGDSDESLGGSGGLEEDQEFRRLEAVSAVQDELNALGEEEAQQVLQVHKAFLKRKRPLYAKRQEAIAEVPDFWLKVLLAHPITQPYISDGDQLALLYLESISVHKAAAAAAAAESATAESEKQAGGADKPSSSKHAGENGGREEPLDDDDDVGFRVTFAFRDNPFFSNTELWREWEASEGQAAFSAVEWKDTEDSRELQAYLLWNLDPEADPEETPSFFSIFGDDMEDDYELGEALRGDITDNPLDIYMRHDFDAEAEEEEGEEGESGEFDDEEGRQEGVEAAGEDIDFE
eukprot:g13999.t1